MQSHVRITCMALVMLLIAPVAGAWSYKEHILFTRMAALRLLEDPTTPQVMKDWLTQGLGDKPDLSSLEEFFLRGRIGVNPSGLSGLSRWCYMPDENSLYTPASSKVQPFNVHEKQLHFIDLELFITGDRKREYKHDLSNKPSIGDIPRDMSDPRYVQAGMLPFRAEHCYNELVKSIRENRLTAPTRSEQEGRTAIYWAGLLVHYTADSTQPQHASMDYKSAAYFADKRTAPNVHAEVEYRMCDDAEQGYPQLRAEYWPLFVKYLREYKDPSRTQDIWLATLQQSMQSYDALPLIGVAAMKAGGQAGTAEHPQGPHAATFDTEAFFRFQGPYMGRTMSVMEMKAIQNAWAVMRIQAVLKQAWLEARP